MFVATVLAGVGVVEFNDSVRLGVVGVDTEGVGIDTVGSVDRAAADDPWTGLVDKTSVLGADTTGLTGFSAI